MAKINFKHDDDVVVTYDNSIRFFIYFLQSRRIGDPPGDAGVWEFCATIHHTRQVPFCLHAAYVRLASLTPEASQPLYYINSGTTSLELSLLNLVTINFLYYYTPIGGISLTNN